MMQMVGLRLLGSLVICVLLFGAIGHLLEKPAFGDSKILREKAAAYIKAANLKVEAEKAQEVADVAQSEVDKAERIVKTTDYINQAN